MGVTRVGTNLATDLLITTAQVGQTASASTGMTVTDVIPLEADFEVDSEADSKEDFKTLLGVVIKAVLEAVIKVAGISPNNKTDPACLDVNSAVNTDITQENVKEIIRNVLIAMDPAKRSKTLRAELTYNRGETQTIHQE
jgi:hypothetical protein